MKPMGELLKVLILVYMVKFRLLNEFPIMKRDYVIGGFGKEIAL